MTQQNKSESQEKAHRSSTIIQFYDRCCESVEVKRPWNSLSPQTMMQFTQAVSYMHHVIYNGG